MFKAVMFDLDGTTVDTLDDLMNAMNSMLVHFGYPKRSKEEIRSFLGFGQRIFVSKSLPEYARRDDIIDKCNAYYDAYYAEHIADDSRPYDGITEICEKLKACGAYTVILSNKNQGHVSRIVGTLFDKELFDVVAGAGSFRHKPDPDCALSIAKELGVSPSECAFVGDSEVDIMTAKNAGMYAVGVTWGFRERSVLVSAGADAVCDDAESLSNVLEI